MDFEPVVLDRLDGRENALAGIVRYIHENTPVMFYRTNDLIHSRRVLWHLEEAIPNIVSVYGDNFNVTFARTLALVHDDAEIIGGDVQLYDKEQMTPEELDELAKAERAIIPEMVRKYGSVANGIGYERLLTAAKDKDCLEAQFVSFFDKFDGGGEAWHEIWAGNNYFLLPGGGNNSHSGGYVKRLNEFPTKYPAMARFFEQFPQYLPQPFDFKSAAEGSKPHTAKSLEEDSGYPHYERWKRTIMKHESIDFLVTQVEFQ